MLVVCIDAKDRPNTKLKVSKYLYEKNIYTVVEETKCREGHIGYKLAEIKADIFFRSDRFRPINDPDISLFQSMLTKVVIHVPNVNDDNPYIRQTEKVS